jgi:hypothetical protein
LQPVQCQLNDQALAPLLLDVTQRDIKRYNNTGLVADANGAEQNAAQGADGNVSSPNNRTPRSRISGIQTNREAMGGNTSKETRLYVSVRFSIELFKYDTSSGRL